MVNNQDKARRRLTRYDHEELQCLRYRGYSIAAIAQRMGVSQSAVRYRFQEYGLDQPVSLVEAVRLELVAAFRETSRRMGQKDVSDAEHARLCGVQVKLGLALLRVPQTDMETGEDGMTNTMKGSASSLDKMSDEDKRNELRRLVGLDTKGVDGGILSGSAGSGCGALPEDTICEMGHASTETSDGG